jgi:Fe-S protein assembly co-chaperone HscB
MVSIRDEIDFGADYFSLFGIPPSFRTEGWALDKRFREIQAQVHPDKFIHAEESERRLSLQWATHVNEAYQVLKNPLSRAKYLLDLAGQDIDEKNNANMPSEFLVEQMEWRENVAEARQARGYDELEQLRQRVRQQMNARYEQLAELIDDKHDYVVAADHVRRLMFLERLLAEIDEGLTALEA